jgi:NAD dependent epimerase/dehydratase
MSQRTMDAHVAQTDPAAVPASEFWAGRRALVTGGCGFIGSHLVEVLLSLGVEVVVLDAYNSTSSVGFLSAVDDPALEVRLGDVADPFLVRELSAGVDTVFHLAALIGIPYSYIAPAHYIRTNVEGTLAVLEAAKAEGVRRVMHTSTSETYGSAQFEPMDESHPLVAQSPYAATKVAADQLAGSYFRSFDVPVTTLRPFNTFGPRQSMRAVLPTLMVQALYSDRIMVGSLDPVRDMNYVADTVGAFVSAASAEGVEGEVFNIGSGRGRTVGEMLDAVQRVVGSELPVVQEPTRVRPAKSEVRALICDFKKAASAFAYEPTVDFEDGLARLRDHLLAEGSPVDINAYRV